MRERASLTVLTATAYESFGGAERIAVGLHSAYLERGIDSWIALGRASGALPRSLQIPHDRYRGVWARPLLRAASAADGASRGRGDLQWRLSRSLKVMAEPYRYARIMAGHEDFDYPASSHLLELPPRVPDVLHLHSLHGGYFDVRALPALSAAVPTVLTLHDAWLLTGHCAHPLDCPRWETACGPCPYPGLYVPIRRDASTANQAVKRAALKMSRVYLATPSAWLMRLVERSGIATDAVEARVIPNGVDTTVFSPGDRTAARDRLGLPVDAAVVLFAAREIEANPFKDYATLTQALARVRGQRAGDPILVALGATGALPAAPGANVRTVPFVEDPAVVAQYYRAADVYVHAARAENLPLAVIEAMACGTPVIASAVGGVPEIVADGETGLLVPPGDPAALATAVERLLASQEMRHAMGSAGAARARARFDFAQQVDAYLGWYEQMLG